MASLFGHEVGSRWKAIDWNAVFDKKVEADHLFLRTGLVRKDRLIKHAGEGALPPTFIVNTLEEALDALSSSSSSSTSSCPVPWVCKLTDSSNSYGLFFVVCEPCTGQPPRIIAGEEVLHEAFHQDHEEPASQEASPPIPKKRRSRRILQRYIESKLIYGGHKFHLRCLILVRGVMTVHLHKEVRVLVAPVPLRLPLDPLSFITERHSHITNRSFNINHPDYDPTKHNLNLDDCPELSPTHVRQQIKGIIRQLFRSLSQSRRDFFPLPNCYELFGLDFMVDHTGQVFLLEANPEPSFDMYSTMTRESCLFPGGSQGGPSPLDHPPPGFEDVCYSLALERAFTSMMGKGSNGDDQTAQEVLTAAMKCE